MVHEEMSMKVSVLMRLRADMVIFFGSESTRKSVCRDLLDSVCVNPAMSIISREYAGFLVKAASSESSSSP